jgi:VWFA-related protein
MKVPRRSPIVARVLGLFTMTTVLGAATGSAAVRGPGPQDNIELKGNLIEVRAVVTDERGRPRGDLERGDFEVLDNGRVQEIAFFSVERVGEAAPRAADTTAALPGTRSTEPSVRKPVSPTRSVVLFADTLHLSASSLVETKKALRAFVDTQMTDGDVAAVVVTDGSLGLASQFTQDRNLLRAAVDKISASGGAAQRGPFTPYLAASIARSDNAEALTLAKYIILRDENIPPEQHVSIEESKRLEAIARQRALEILADETGRRRRTIETLKAVANQMAALPGQRLLTLFTDGFTLADSRGDFQSSDVRAAIDRAVRSGVVIYTIDPGGLQSGFSASFDDNIATGPPGLFAGYETASRRDLEQVGTALARDTGGEVIRNTNDLSEAFRKILDANRVYYALAFYVPEDEKTAKRFREIAVRLKNRPGLTVRAQRGYMTSGPADPTPGGAADGITAALSSPFALTQIPVSARADLVAVGDSGARVVVTVHVDGGALEFKEEGDRHTFAIDVATTVLDGAGKDVETKSETLQGSLVARPYELAKANGFRVTRELLLKPGQYQVRAAVREGATGRLGSATTLVEIPDVGRGRLAASSILLAESASDTGTVFTPRTRGGRQTFAAGDFLIYSLTLFNAGDAKNGERDLTMRISILRDGNAVFESPREPIAAHLVERRGTAAVISGQLKLTGVPAGPYTFRIEFRDAHRKQTAAQIAEFSVGQ